MRNVLSAAIVAAVVAGGVAWTITQASHKKTPDVPSDQTARNVAEMLLRYKQNPAATSIYLHDYADGKGCVAEVDADPVGNLNKKGVLWFVLNDNCALAPHETYPKVSLVFIPHPTTGQYPFKTKRVDSKRAADLVYIHDTIKPEGMHQDNEVQRTKYKYEVWLQNGPTGSVKVLDPDLEVEPPIILTPPGAPAPRP